MVGAFDGPHLDGAERARVEADWSAIAREGAGVYGNFLTTTDPAVAATLYPADTMARPPQPQRPARLSGPDVGGAGSARQWVSSASISVRSPDHRVWKVPGLSMRLYVWAPKKSRCPCTSAAGRRSARMPS